MAYLACLAGCEGRHDPFKPLFSCPTCGGLLDVEHDLEPLKERSAASWKTTLAERASSSDARDRSGVWRHREWVMPELEAEHVVTIGEGNSPLVDVERLAEAWGIGALALKQCGQSPTGSFKDLGMTVLVSMANAMRAKGEDVRALVCASTGDTSAALAAYGARAGIPVVVLLPKGKISMAQLVQPVSAGAHVLALDGDFDQCMRVVQELCEQPGMFLANSKNPLRIEGQKTVAFEIAAQRGFKVPDVVAVPSGNLGNVSALWRGFSLLVELGLTDRMPRLVACQVDAANPLYRAYRGGLTSIEPVVAEDTHASAIRIGNPVSWPRARRALKETDGVVTSVSEGALLEASLQADAEGMFVCPHTAAALAGVKALAADGTIGKDDDVVVVSTAHGLKFADQKATFHEGGTAVAGLSFSDAVLAGRNPPVELAASLDAVTGALEERLRG